jgi:hypothetical protein
MELLAGSRTTADRNRLRRQRTRVVESSNSMARLGALEVAAE